MMMSMGESTVSCKKVEVRYSLDHPRLAYLDNLKMLDHLDDGKLGEVVQTSIEECSAKVKEVEADQRWVQCKNECCQKWHKVPEDAVLLDIFTCVHNMWDQDHNTCKAPEKVYQEGEGEQPRLSTRNVIVNHACRKITKITRNCTVNHTCA